MNKTLLGVIVTVLALAGIGAIVVANQKDKEPAVTTPTTQPSIESEQNHTENQTTQESTTSDVLSGTVNMDIKNTAYTKPSMKIKQGTKVVWTNQDAVQHDVKPDSETVTFIGSELLSKGESYEFTFSTVGTYTYHCTPHPFMKGTVEVVE